MSKRKPRRASAAAVELPITPEFVPGERLRPWLLAGVTALFVARPLFASEGAIFRGDGLPIVMGWLALAVFWLLGAVGHRRFPILFGWIDAAMLLLVGIHTVAAIVGSYWGAPRPAINALWLWVSYFLAFFLVRQFAVGRREIRALVVAMIAAGTVLAAYGLYQFFYELPATEAYYKANPEAALREAEMTLGAGTREIELFEKRLESREPLSCFALTNSLAGYLAPWLIVAMGIAVTATRTAEGRTPKPFWLGLLAVAGATGLCLVLTKSRSGYLATLLGAGLVALLWSRGSRLPSGKTLAIAAALIAVCLGVAVAIGGLDLPVLSEAVKSLGYRLEWWQSSLAMIADHPWLGCGPGNFQDCYLAYKLPHSSEGIADPHNFVFEIWTTAGTAAMFALLAVIGGFFWTVLRVPKPSEDAASTPCKAGDETVAATPSADDPRFVYGGVAMGFVLSIFVGMVSEAAPSPWVPLVGLLLASAVMALLHDWVRFGSISAGLVAIGVTVLLVNLLAAGSLGFPGVVGTLWLLMALGLNLRGHGRSVPVKQVALYGLLAITFLLVVACYVTAYNPVLQARTAMHPANATPFDPLAEKRLLDAAEADPFSAEPWVRLTGLTFAQWEAGGPPELLGRFELYASKTMQLAPQSPSIRWSIGEYYSRAYAKMGKKEHLDRAIDAYRLAIVRYPNNAVYEASLAIALNTAGDQAGFEEHAERARWLDEATPHADCKLTPELRKSLQRNTPDLK